MLILLITALLAAVFSFASGLLAERLTEPIHLLGTFVALRLSYNPGIAFGISIPSPWQEIIIVTALAAVCVFAIKSKPDRLASAAFGLIIGGATTNIIDRISDSFVTDFISIGTFPIFNLADSCITVGAGMMLTQAYFKKQK